MAVTVPLKSRRKSRAGIACWHHSVEVDSRLKLARTVKMDGFRPGKVPMNVTWLSATATRCTTR
jgi:FKBP-type peptidyl-prolyl cis-trans isomerase (trigger factor)